MYNLSNSRLFKPRELGLILLSGLALDIIAASSRRSCLSVLQYQKTFQAERAEKEGRSASSSSPETSTNLIPMLVDFNEDVSVASLVKAEDLGPVGRSIV
jgi:hypothetical protein